MTSLDRLIANCNSIIYSLKVFSSNVPQDVTYQWVNDDDSVTDITYMNIVKYQKHIGDLMDIDSTGAVANALALNGVDGSILLNRIATLENNVSPYTDNVDIVAAYNSIISEVTSAEIIEGTSTDIKLWSPADVKNSIHAHGSKITQDSDTVTVYKDEGDVEHKLYLETTGIVVENKSDQSKRTVLDTSNYQGYVSEMNTSRIYMLPTVGKGAMPAHYMLALTNNNEFLFWGYNASDTFVAGGGNDPWGTYTVHNPKPDVPVKEIIIAEYDVFVLYEDSELYAMGVNNYGELGIGNSARCYQLILTSTNVKQVSISAIGHHTGYKTTMILKNDGMVMGAGYNGSGQLALGHTTNSNTWQIPTIPTDVGFVTEIHVVNTANCWVYALTSLGKVLSVGYNGFGQLGLGNSTTIHTFSRISGLDSVFITKIAYHGGAYNGSYRGSTLVLTDNYDLYGWGGNAYGQLGLGNTTVTVTPTKITISELASDDYIVEIIASTGEWGQFYLLSNKGDLFGAGYNGHGQLGVGNTSNKSTFVKIASNISRLFMINGLYQSYYSSCIAITKDNILLGWGYNGSGQLGLNDTTQRTSPTVIPFQFTDKVVDIVCSGNNHLVTVHIHLTDGSVYGAGYNNYQNVTTGFSTGNIRRFIKTI